MANFTERLRQLRDESGKTQSQIAKELGLTPQAFSYFVNGREPNYETLGKIADYFGVSTDYLLGRSDIKTVSIMKKAICDETKLSEEAIDRLHSYVDLKYCGGKTFDRIFVGEFIEDLLSHDEIFALVGNYQMYKQAGELVKIWGNTVEWYLENLDCEPVKSMVAAIKKLHDGMENTNSVYALISGNDYLDFYKQKASNLFFGLLPKMAGIEENNDNFKKKLQSFSDLWTELYTRLNQIVNTPGEGKEG